MSPSSIYRAKAKMHLLFNCDGPLPQQLVQSMEHDWYEILLKVPEEHGPEVHPAMREFVGTRVFKKYPIEIPELEDAWHRMQSYKFHPSVINRYRLSYRRTVPIPRWIRMPKAMTDYWENDEQVIG